MKMKLEDKIAFCDGADFWHTKEMPEYNIDSIMMSDGPHGLRCQKGVSDMLGINKSLPATCFPTAVTAGATWNEELYAAEGEAIGKEAAAAGVSIVLGPGCNIKRNPLGGRNFEYLSEDPYLAGKMAAAFIKKQQSVGVDSSLKHYAVNSQEYKRQNGDSQIDERTLREIYLTPFEIAVKEAQPGTVMCAYNKVNGIHCSDHTYLLNDILRKEWGFEGLVVTDWGAMNNKIKAFKAGCDLNMPGGNPYMEKETADAVRKGILDESYIDRSAERILRLVKKHSSVKKDVCVDWEQHHELALEVARQGAVLLKNDDHILPLKDSDFVLIGKMAENMRYQGTGSSHINPKKLVNITDVFKNIPYFPCGDAYGNVFEKDLKTAADEAAKYKRAIVTIGLPESYESEAFDREHMRLPDGYNKLVEAVAEANPDTVVVLLGGSAMELPWEDKVKAILYMGLPGQAGGRAAVDLLTGKVSPSGKLTETWPICYDDVISKETFGVRNPEYREGIYVGYRYYDKASKNVRYPFGYGLSYTTFDYRSLVVEDNKVSFVIQNTGAVKAAEVVQLYIAPPQDGLFRPIKELKRYTKIALEPGEAKNLAFELDDRCFAVWDNGWKIPAGAYTVMIASSVQDIRLESSVQVDGVVLDVPDWQSDSWYAALEGAPSREDWELLMGYKVPVIPEPVKGQFTMDNTCLEMMDSSFVMKIQYKITENIVAKGFDGKKDLSDPAYRMMLICATDAPMRSVVISSGGKMSESMAKGLLAMANGHYLKGIKHFFNEVAAKKRSDSF